MQVKCPSSPLAYQCGLIRRPASVLLSERGTGRAFGKADESVLSPGSLKWAMLEKTLNLPESETRSPWAGLIQTLSRDSCRLSHPLVCFSVVLFPIT